MRIATLALIAGAIAVCGIASRAPAGDLRTAPPESKPAQPALTLRPGERFFRLGDRPTFVLGRNPTGRNLEEFAPLFKDAAQAGERLVRIHLTNGLPLKAPAGRVDAAWAEQWDRIFAVAAERGLYVLPVFGVWADWNDGSGGLPWHAWNRNPYNAANGGPARHPADLLRDTPCRRLWLEWLAALARRWQGRENLLGWEVFSELDLVTGTSEEAACEFLSQAARTIRGADLRRRPVTASLSGIQEWPRLFGSDALDILQVHPYANDPKYHGNLDEMILACVRKRLERYGKPVFLGESGLDSRGPREALVADPRAEIGIRHALWAAAVSGAMNGRMLWWEDGYDRYHGLDLHTRYGPAAAPVARFVEGMDFAGFAPLPVTPSGDLMGAALGNERQVVAWFRDARCVAPDWPLRRMEGQAVVLAPPGPCAAWTVEFRDPVGGRLLSPTTVRRENQTLTVGLPAFEGSLVLRLQAAGK